MTMVPKRSKLSPVIVRLVPPARGPNKGVMDSTSGNSKKKKKNINAYKAILLKTYDHIFIVVSTGYHSIETERYKNH